MTTVPGNIEMHIEYCCDGFHVQKLCSLTVGILQKKTDVNY